MFGRFCLPKVARRFITTPSITHPKNVAAQTLRHYQIIERVPFAQGIAIQEQFVGATLEMKKIEKKIRQKVLEVGDRFGPEAMINENEKRILDQILELKPNPTLFTFEFEPTYTGGKRIKKSITDEQIKEFENFKVFEGSMDPKPKFALVDRGGQITFHGPGQMVAYLILDLENFENFRIRDYVCALENAAVNTLKNIQNDGVPLGLQTRIGNDNEVGLWTSDTNQKIGSLGINIKRYITSHGVCINVNPQLDYLNKFEMCGLADKKATSILNEKPDAKITVQDISIQYAKELCKILGIQKLERMQVDDVESFLNPPESLESTSSKKEN